MKYIIYIVLFTCTFESCSTGTSNNSGETTKEFEGKITYITEVVSKSPGFSTAQLQSFYGDTMTMFIKHGKYRMSHNGIDVKDEYYFSKNNFQYTYRNGIDTLYANSCDTEKDKLIKSEFESVAEIILNRKCSHITNAVGIYRYHYWYDPDMYIDPQNFENHHFGYLNVYYEKAKAIWIKHKYEGVKFDLIYTAIKIEELSPDDSIFNLPDLPESILK